MRSPVPSVSNRTFVEYSSMTNGATAFLLGFATGDFRGAAVCACDVRGAAKNKVTHAAKQIVANEIFVVILVIGAAGTRCEWILISASCSLVSFYHLVKHRVRESFHKDLRRMWDAHPRLWDWQAACRGKQAPFRWGEITRVLASQCRLSEASQRQLLKLEPSNAPAIPGT